MSKSKKSLKSKSDRKSPQSPRSKFVPILVLAFLGAGAAAYFLFFQKGPGPEQPSQSVNAAKPPQTKDMPGLGTDARRLIGRWTRPDGGYIIEIRNLDANGLAEAGYFNPRPIHVSQAVVTRKNDALELFMELRDTGYPGSTYTLAYDAQRDLLAGIYYQAVMDQSFEVIFLRAK
jgi:hypothetical protein